MPTKEICVIPTYKRPELLFLCLANLRAHYDGPVVVFADRGDKHPEYYRMTEVFDVLFNTGMEHSFYGNSFNAMRALTFGYDSGADSVLYLEDDCIVTDRWLPWTRSTHEDTKLFGDIFCSAGWIGNRSQPCRDSTYFTPWIYIPQFSIQRKHLKKIIDHFKPEYLRDMGGYCRRVFPNSPLNRMGGMNNHFEIDGLIQHIIAENQSLQVAWNGWPTVKHLGFAGYNRGGYTPYEDFFKGAEAFKDRVSRISEFSMDPSWRTQYFERELVEKEEGGRIQSQNYLYKIDIGTFTSLYECNIPPRGLLPKVINGVPIPDDAKITLVGRKSIP